MKKIFSFIIGLVAATALQAANTEVAYIILKGQGGEEQSYISLTVDPAQATPELTSFVGVTDEDGQLNLYINNGSEKLSGYKANEISDLPLEVVTNRRATQHYTMSFLVTTSTVGLKLYDMAVNPTTPIDIINGGTYEFDVNTTLHPDFVAGTNYVIKDRFVINATPVAESLCFNNNILEVNGYTGKSLVIKQGASEIVNIPSLGTTYQKDLGAYSGRLVVTLDGKDYQIDVNPTVTSYTPAP